MNQALILAGDRSVTRERVTLPSPSPTQVLIETDVVGICASDIALWKGSYSAPHTNAVVFGHEWAGRVIEVGARVGNVQPGALVTGECSLWCGICDRCLANRNVCRKIEKFGITADGAARSRFLFEAKYLHEAPAGQPSELVALTEPLAVCMSALKSSMRTDLAADRILIFGGGMIGLGCLLLLKRHYKASEVFLHDVLPGRQEQAISLGAKPLGLDLKKTASAPADYAGMYGGDGFDLILDTTGSASAFYQAMRVANPNATLTLLGYTPEVAFPVKDIVTKNIRIVGSIGGSGCFDEVLGFIAAAGNELRTLIGASYTPDQAEAAFLAAEAGSLAPKQQIRFQT